MSTGFHVDKLSDEFGQYTLVLKCAECGHERKAEPLTLGRLCGWDARLEDVAKRMRCSRCGKKRCTLKAQFVYEELHAHQSRHCRISSA